MRVSTQTEEERKQTIQPLSISNRKFTTEYKYKYNNDFNDIYNALNNIYDKSTTAYKVQVQLKVQLVNKLNKKDIIIRFIDIFKNIFAQRFNATWEIGY